MKQRNTSFGEYAVMVSVNDVENKKRAIFRIGKIRPSYAEIICFSDIFRSHKCSMKVPIDQVKTWPDFLKACEDLAAEQGFVIHDCDWSFSCRF